MPPSPAYRLSDDVAQRRVLYPAPLVTAPSALVIEIPAAMRGSGLALGRYYPIILESEAETVEAERYLQAPRAAPGLPDLFDHRPSALISSDILVIHYAPPAAGWPWLAVVRWPDVARAGLPAPTLLARGCYTMEMFEGLEAMRAHGQALVARLRRRHAISVGHLTPGQLGAPGNA